MQTHLGCLLDELLVELVQRLDVCAKTFGISTKESRGPS